MGGSGQATDAPFSHVEPSLNSYSHLRTYITKNSSHYNPIHWPSYKLQALSAVCRAQKDDTDDHEINILNSGGIPTALNSSRKKQRSASRHSKAANDAYLRGDHLFARELSLKAQEEWSAAEKLNVKAAKEIFTISNKTNEWKLDLDGLHAAEAVQFLSEHLEKIESQLPVTYSENTNTENVEMGPTHVISLDYSCSVELERSNKQQQSSRQKLLEVVTGNGNHSRGQATIPIAVRNFLGEKGYHYYEPRDGVIKVQPKFHRM